MPEKSDVEQNKAVSILSYIGILFLVPLLAAPKSPFAQFHARQGMVLFIAEIILWIVFYGLTFVTLGLMWFLLWVPWVCAVIWSIIGIVNVVNGEEKELPLIGGLIKKTGQ